MDILKENTSDTKQTVKSTFYEKLEALHQNVTNIKELASDIEQLYIESETYKSQLLTQKEKCKSKSCPGSEALMRLVEKKDNIIQSVAAALTQLSKTKNFNIIADIFKMLFDDVSILPQSNKKENISPPANIKNELNTSIADDVSFKDESVLEIEGTPTGRTSPILPARILRTTMVNSAARDKKKCPDNWSTPEKKNMKLTNRTPTRSKPGAKWRQQRLTTVKVKDSNVVDLTSSPEFALGSRTHSTVQMLIKKESVENDDTILPSPTSGSTEFPSLLKTAIKPSPKKTNRPLPLSCLNVKSECVTDTTVNDENKTNIPDVEMELSINILQQCPDRFKSNGYIQTTKKKNHYEEETTLCENDSSISLLDHVNKLQNIQKDTNQVLNSPSKCPLAENINLINVEADGDSSMSLIQRDINTDIRPAIPDTVKRKTPDLPEPIYKEPAVRKKAEKRALPGWSCEECKNFYDELHKDDPVMLAKKMQECSKHRGRNNPVKPNVPPGFWNPRWSVPEDTEEFNRRNNAV